MTIIGESRKSKSLFGLRQGHKLKCQQGPGGPMRARRSAGCVDPTLSQEGSCHSTQWIVAPTGLRSGLPELWRFLRAAGNPDPYVKYHHF